MPRPRSPTVVLEIADVITIAPSVLDWIHIDLLVAMLAYPALAFLLFLGELEIDVHRHLGPLLR